MLLSLLPAALAGVLAGVPLAAQEARPPDAGAAELVEIVLDNENFLPIDIYHDNGGMSVPVTWRGCKAADIMGKLKRKKPAAITSEPRYEGSRRLYGSLVLGNRKDNRYHFAMDVIAPDRMLMYFDYDNDGRLDGHPPLAHEGVFKPGENGFAALIRMPWDRLIEDSPYHGEFLIWFMINSNMWANSGFSHSSHTELTGKVDIGGTTYNVTIADSAENDNDGVLTNDGLYLRRGEEEPRYISDEEARSGATVDGKSYRFRIRYASGGAPSGPRP